MTTHAGARECMPLQPRSRWARHLRVAAPMRKFALFARNRSLWPCVRHRRASRRGPCGARHRGRTASWRRPLRPRQSRRLSCVARVARDGMFVTRVERFLTAPSPQLIEPEVRGHAKKPGPRVWRRLPICPRVTNARAIMSCAKSSASHGLRVIEAASRASRWRRAPLGSPQASLGCSLAPSRGPRRATRRHRQWLLAASIRASSCPTRQTDAKRSKLDGRTSPAGHDEERQELTSRASPDHRTARARCFACAGTARACAGSPAG
jgi:hypothetical protein